MSMTILWAIAAAACLVAELMTGTFYLLVLCLAFSVGCGLAALDVSLSVQIVAAAITGLLGIVLVRRWRSRNNAVSPTPPIATNALVTIISSQGSRYRVRWRGTEWDANGPAGMPENATAMISGQTGNTLHIEPR